MENKKSKSKNQNGFVNAIRRSEKNIRNILDSVKHSVPQITIPEMSVPESIIALSKIKSSRAIGEQNAWKRHAENINIQENILKIQSKILYEQRVASKLTCWILILTILSLVLAVIRLLGRV